MPSQFAKAFGDALTTLYFQTAAKIFGRLRLPVPASYAGRATIFRTAVRTMVPVRPFGPEDFRADDSMELGASRCRSGADQALARGKATATCLEERAMSRASSHIDSKMNTDIRSFGYFNISIHP